MRMRAQVTQELSPVHHRHVDVADDQIRRHLLQALERHLTVAHHIEQEGHLTLHLPPLKLVAEMYSVQVIIREPGFARILSGQIATTFHVRHPMFDTHFGTFHESAVKWEISEAQPLARIANGQR